MKTTSLTVEEFKKYIPRVKCINLFHYNLINTAKLAEVSKVSKVEFEKPEDLEQLKTDKLVWYVNDLNERVYWNEVKARNLTLHEEAASYLNKAMNQKLSQTVKSLRDGLTMDVEIVSIHDSTYNERVIVDGIYRAVALYYLYLTERETVEKLLQSVHRIYSVIFHSPAGALLFPCDFINIARDHGKGETPS